VGEGRQGEKELLFLKKKKQKDFRSCGRWQQLRQAPHEAKVFSKK